MQELLLDGSWRFQPDPFHEGEALGWQLLDHDVSRWAEVNVPTVFDRCGPGLVGYEGAGWFRRTVRLPEAWKGRAVVLRCGAVNHRARVWINGVLAGANEDGFLPFDLVLPVEALKWGGAENLLVIEGDNTRRIGDIPGRQRGWRPYGGILRSVTLSVRPMAYLAEVRITADLGPGSSSRAGSVRIDLVVGNEGPDVESVRCEVVLTAPDGNEVSTRTSKSHLVVEHIPREGCVHATGELWVADVARWSPQTPALYQAHLRLFEGNRLLDARTIRFGFRRVAVDNGKLTLNGQPLLLLGFNRHDDSPRTDQCPDPATARQDLLRMKQMGANMVRLCHYPHDPSTLDLCDDLGLLVMAEIPLYWWKGYEEGGEEGHEATRLAARRQLSRLLQRDSHHPCVIAWSVSNETDDERPEVAEGNQELVRFVKERDPSRLAVHVSDKWQGHLNFEADDVICVNSYPYLRGRSWGEGERLDAPGSGAWWREHLNKLHAQYPNKPILVTEFGHPAIEGVVEGAAGEAIQAEVLREQLGGILGAGDFVSGALIWCWADHPWPEDEWLNRVTTSPFGIVTRERRSKQSAAIVERAFLRTTSGPSLFLRRPHLDDLPPLELPEGYTLRALCGEEEADLEGVATVLQGAFPEMTWNADKVREALIDDTSVKAVFVIEGPDGSLVATASARLLPDEFPGSGYIHWVGGAPGHRGKRLGYLASLATLHEFVRLGCSDVVLHTDDFRIPAIKVYLNLGFIPAYNHATHATRWARLAPGLEGYL